jgi:hypothetical protein
MTYVDWRSNSVVKYTINKSKQNQLVGGSDLQIVLFLVKVTFLEYTLCGHVDCVPYLYSINRHQVAQVEGTTEYNEWVVADSRQGVLVDRGVGRELARPRKVTKY